MSMKGKKDEIVGKAKEKIGDMTDNEKLQAKGMAQEAKGKVEQGADAVRDAAKDIKKKMT
ncbi:CsbD family protein [Longispora sp. K20-0274]|uniref:CsbD family protein n=1 Tax=Longispora sp. K20-0274 TaxID=3088255 RepID=UPI00399B013F